MKKVLFLSMIIAILLLMSCRSSEPKEENIIEPKLLYENPEIWTYGTAFSKTAFAKGVITNIGTVPAYNVKATVTFYNSSGIILDVNDNSLDELAVGQKWEYSIYYTGTPTTDLARAHVVVTADAKPSETPKAKVTIK